MSDHRTVDNGDAADVFAAMDDVTLPTCHGCGRPVDPNWRYCPNCGAELDT